MINKVINNAKLGLVWLIKEMKKFNYILECFGILKLRFCNLMKYHFPTNCFLALLGLTLTWNSHLRVRHHMMMPSGRQLLLWRHGTEHNDT
jgi:hypothetical protein